MHLLESGEMYLETILILSQKRGIVRSLDVADYMNFSKPSVSRAVGLLRDGGYLTVDKDGFLHLTADGQAIAEKIYARHTTLTALLEHFGVDPETAATDACKMEHDISDSTYEAICRFLEKEKG
jgi:Mn-dependent DtxR family transcriptional regulator